MTFESSRRGRGEPNTQSRRGCQADAASGPDGWGWRGQGRLGRVNEQHPLVDPVSPFGDIQVKRLDKELPLPHRAHGGDAGADLYAAHDVILRPGERALVGTGIALALPMGTVGLVHPRSGLAAKHGISVVNTPGTIDAEYRGEIKVCLINHDPEETFEVTRGMRIAQLIVQRVELVGFQEVEELDDTARGDGGYGSTGVN